MRVRVRVRPRVRVRTRVRTRTRTRVRTRVAVEVRVARGVGPTAHRRFEPSANSSHTPAAPRAASTATWVSPGTVTLPSSPG